MFEAAAGSEPSEPRAPTLSGIGRERVWLIGSRIRPMRAGSESTKDRMLTGTLSVSLCKKESERGSVEGVMDIPNELSNCSFAILMYPLSIFLRRIYVAI